MGFISSYLDGKYFLRVYYVLGTEQLKNITFEIRHWKNFISLPPPDVDIWYSRGNIIDVQTVDVVASDSYLFPNNEKKTIFTTKGRWEDTGEIGWQDSPNSKVCYQYDAVAKKDILDMYAVCEVPVAVTFFARSKTVILTANVVESSIRRGFAIGNVTGINAQGKRVPIPVHKPSLRDR